MLIAENLNRVRLTINWSQDNSSIGTDHLGQYWDRPFSTGAKTIAVLGQTIWDISAKTLAFQWFTIEAWTTKWNCRYHLICTQHLRVFSSQYSYQRYLIEHTLFCCLPCTSVGIHIDHFKLSLLELLFLFRNDGQLTCHNEYCTIVSYSHWGHNQTTLVRWQRWTFLQW